jgi:predicted RNA-binding protein with RPS1 domain
LIHLSEISHGVVKDIRDYIKVGEEVTAKIINFEPTKKRIGLSLKALQKAPKEEKIKEVKKAEEDKIDEEVATKESKKPATKKVAPKNDAVEKKPASKKETPKKEDK